MGPAFFIKSSTVNYMQSYVKSYMGTFRKVATFVSALAVSAACSASNNPGHGNEALLVEKHAEFILKNKSKIESHFEVVIKVLESEKYKEPILRFVKESNGRSNLPPITDFVLVKALNHFQQSPLDLVLDAHKALNLPRSTKAGNEKLSALYVIPLDPSYISALTTGYQLSPSAVEKATEAAEFLIPLYSLLLDTLLEFDEFDQPEFRYSGGGSQHATNGFASKYYLLGSSDARLNDEIPLKAFFPILMALDPANHRSMYVPKDQLLSYEDQQNKQFRGFKNLNISQLRLLEKVYDFINAYNFYWYPGYESHYGEAVLSSIQVAIEKRESEVVDFSDLGADGGGSSKGAEESSGLDFGDLEL